MKFSRDDIIKSTSAALAFAAMGAGAFAFSREAVVSSNPRQPDETTGMTIGHPIKGVGVVYISDNQHKTISLSWEVCIGLFVLSLLFALLSTFLKAKTRQ